jgi:hypothetical protein
MENIYPCPWELYLPWGKIEMKFIFFNCKMEMCKQGCSCKECLEPVPEHEPEPETDPEVERERIRLNWIAQCQRRMANKSSDA